MNEVRKIPFISSSIMNNFLNCKFSFLQFYKNDGYSTYRQDNEVDEPIYLQFGSLIHGVIEKFWKSKTRTKQFLLKTYEDDIVSNGFSDKDYINTGFDIFEYFFNYLLKAPKRKLLHSELSYNVNINGINLHGTIDAIFYHGDGIYEIEDYKTSNYVKTQDEVDEDVQLSMYDYIFSNSVMKKFWFNGIKPKAIILTLHFLKHGKVVNSERTEQSRTRFSIYLKLIHREMSELRDRDMKPCLNKFCSYCEYSDTCPLYDAVISGEYEPKEKEDYVINEIHQYNEYSNMIKILQKEADYHYNEAKDYLQNEDKAIEYDGYMYYIGQNGKRYVNKEKVLSILKKYNLYSDEFELQHLSIPLSAIDKIIKENPELEDEIQETIGFTYYKPSLMTKKAPKLFK